MRVSLTAGAANVLRGKFQKTYEKKGSGEVYNDANKIKLPYSYCSPCDTQTPTIEDKLTKTCAICGSLK